MMYLNDFQVLLETGLLQDFASNLKSRVDVYEKVVILHCIAKCGHSQQVFTHIPVSVLLDIILKVR